MSKYLSGIAVVLTAGSLMAAQPASPSPLGSFPHVAFALVAENHGGGSGGGDRGGSSDRGGESRGHDGEAEAGDDNGGNGELEPEDDKGVDVNDQLDDSAALLLPTVAQ